MTKYEIEQKRERLVKYTENKFKQCNDILTELQSVHNALQDVDVQILVTDILIYKKDLKKNIYIFSKDFNDSEFVYFDEKSYVEYHEKRLGALQYRCTCFKTRDEINKFRYHGR